VSQKKGARKKSFGERRGVWVNQVKGKRGFCTLGNGEKKRTKKERLGRGAIPRGEKRYAKGQYVIGKYGKRGKPGGERRGRGGEDGGWEDALT